MVLARAAAARAEVVLEVRVAARDRGHPLQRFLRERRSAEVGVDDHAGGVDRSSKARPARRCELHFHASDQVARIGSGLDLLAGAGKSGSHRRDDQNPWPSAREPFVCRELVDGWQVAQLHRRSVER